MDGIYLLTTSHLEENLWFKDDKDFKVGMNHVAIQAAESPSVYVLAFILMSNHVHFVIRGKGDEVRIFIERFKRRYSLYYRWKYGVKEFLRRNGLDIQAIPYENESVERAIAYVQMNCVAANICLHPSLYPWGTGNCFFNVSPSATAKPVSDVSERHLFKMMHSKCSKVPGTWEIGENGFILPGSYVATKEVEQIFRSPQRMDYFLKSSSKARKRLNATDNATPSFRDQTILGAIPDLCRSLFQKRNFNELDKKEQIEFARQIRFRFSADPNQIARVCNLSYSDAASLLDSI